MDCLRLLVVESTRDELQLDGEAPLADRGLNALAAGRVLGQERGLSLGKGAPREPHGCRGHLIRKEQQRV